MPRAIMPPLPSETPMTLSPNAAAPPICQTAPWLATRGATEVTEVRGDVGRLTTGPTGARETLVVRGGEGRALLKGSGPVLFVRVRRSFEARRSGALDSRKLSLGVWAPGESLEGMKRSLVEGVVGRRTKLGRRGVPNMMNIEWQL